MTKPNPNMNKTFMHKFSDGQVIILECDLTREKPVLHSSLQMKNQTIEIICEYQRWQVQVVIPELMNVLTPEQMIHMVKLGHSKIKQT